MKTAIITGGGTGIGRAAALHLADLGYAVAIAGRREAPLKKVSAEVTKKGGRALAIVTDVSQPDSVQELVGQVLAKWHRIDALINTAGAAVMIPLSDTTPQQWRDMLESNLSSAFYTTRAVWPVMTAQHKNSRPAKKRPRSHRRHYH